MGDLYLQTLLGQLPRRLQAAFGKHHGWFSSKSCMLICWARSHEDAEGELVLLKLIN